MESELDLAIYGEWDFVARLLERFPEFRTTFEEDAWMHGRLPHNVFGICWWPWLEPQLNGPVRGQLISMAAELFSEILSTGNDAWREVVYLSGLSHFRRDAALWRDLRNRADSRVREELALMERHYRIPG